MFSSNKSIKYIQTQNPHQNHLNSLKQNWPPHHVRTTSERFCNNNAVPQPNQAVQCQKLLNFLQMENESIQNKNNELVQILRQKKQKEKQMNQQIKKLQKYKRQLFKKSKVEVSFVKVKEEKEKRKSNIEMLSEEFNELVETSIKEKNTEKRKMIRKELGEIAKEMKMYREDNLGMKKEKGNEKNQLWNYLASF